MIKLLLVILVGLVLAACQMNTAAPAFSLKPGDTFTDNFADNRNDWTMGSTTNVDYRLEQNAYHVKFTVADHSAWPNLVHLFPEDVEAQVDAVLPNVDASTNWGVGLALRGTTRSGNSEFYTYQVKATGQWNIYYHHQSDWKTIKSGSLGFRVDAKKGITLRFMAKGSRFTLWVNNQQVAAVTDETSKPDGNPKYILLFASTPKGQPPIEVEFRNFQAKVAS